MNLSNENRVIVYIRETDKMEYSLKEQIERVRKYCKHLRFKVIDEYIDTEYKNGNKSIFNKLLKDIETREFNIVVSFNFNSISYDDEELDLMMKKLYDNFVELLLEDTYQYHPIPGSLFILPYRKIDSYEEPKKTSNRRKPNNKVNRRCIVNDVEMLNPKLPKFINWAKEWVEEKIMFDDGDELFSENGDYLGLRKNLIYSIKTYNCYCEKKKTKYKGKGLF